MVRNEHLYELIRALAACSMSSWNQWRLENPHFRPEFLGVMLCQADLSYANLSGSRICYSDLRDAKLHHANLHRADLRGSDLRRADLSEADLSYADLRKADLRTADLRHAILRETDLRGANLQMAKLRHADLSGADLTGTLIDRESQRRSNNWFGEGLSLLEKISLEILIQMKPPHLSNAAPAEPIPTDKRSESRLEFYNC